ncbi:MAG: beta-lactamase family protein [Proteobacteria bacterium]|nr:beta-lactamase family protein [Pseudomonadota bacterium]
MNETMLSGEAALLSRRNLLRGGAMLGGAAGLALSPLGRGLAWAATPEAAGWPAMRRLISDATAVHHLPGALAMLGWGDRPATVIAGGTQGMEDSTPLGPDSLFRAYSMTKPLTGMIAAILIDQGKLKLDQPLADFVPEFANPKVAIDPVKSLDAVPATGQITIRHLLTHTAGLGYAGIGQEMVSNTMLQQGVVPAVISRQQIPGRTPPGPTLAPDAFLRAAAALPLVSEPGRKWIYSMGLDVLGLAMERITGKGLETLMDEHLFGPLGMASSWFRVPLTEQARMTSNYGIQQGKIAPLDPAKGSIYRDAPAFAFGGSGLVTSPADYDRFLAMVLGGGKLGGKQLVSPAAVAMAVSNLLPAGADTSVMKPAGSGFGAGARVGISGSDIGFYGWGGAASTVGFVNRRIGLRAGFWVQYMPSEALPVRDGFNAALLQDLAAMAAARKAA